MLSCQAEHPTPLMSHSPSLARAALPSMACKLEDIYRPHECASPLPSNTQILEPFCSRPFWLLLAGNHLNYFVAGAWLPQRLHQNCRNLRVELLISETGTHKTLLAALQDAHSGSFANGARLPQRCELLTVHPNDLSGSWSALFQQNTPANATGQRMLPIMSRCAATCSNRMQLLMMKSIDNIPACRRHVD